MKSIRIKKLRSLLDTGTIDIKPLTILVGKNSVGKSTFLRSFPLLKQSLDTKKNEPILWYSKDSVDFGTFEDSLNHFVKNKNNIENSVDETIDFEFSFEVRGMELLKSSFLSSSPRESFVEHILLNSMNKGVREGNFNIDVSFNVNKEYTKKFKIKIWDVEFIVENSDDRACKLYVNDQEIFGNEKLIWEKSLVDIIPGVYFEKDENKTSKKIKDYSIESEKKRAMDDLSNTISNQAIKDFVEIIKELSSNKTKEDTLLNIISSLSPISYDSFKTSFLKSIQSLRSLNKKFNEKQSEEIFNELHVNFLLIHFETVINCVNRYLSSYFSNVQYVAPIRASAERYYRIQGVAVDNVSSEGENIPMLLRNMKINNHSEFTDWQEWTKNEFDIKFDIKDSESNSSIVLIRDELDINMADTGFGYSQILPILLILWRMKNKKTDNRINYYSITNTSSTLVIEQPELHLHPALQSRLLDIFVEIINYGRREQGLSIIIETHSEAIIKRVGYNVNVTKKLNPEDVNILIFNTNDNDKSVRITSSEFSEKGILKNWPLGFFMPDSREVF